MRKSVVLLILGEVLILSGNLGKGIDSLNAQAEA